LGKRDELMANYGTCDLDESAHLCDEFTSHICRNWRLIIPSPPSSVEGENLAWAASVIQEFITAVASCPSAKQNVRVAKAVKTGEEFLDVFNKQEPDIDIDISGRGGDSYGSL
jgi:hypothetical protein